jgi:Lrp/AsnC family leucine-responsive transcriptional regulator
MNRDDRDNNTMDLTQTDRTILRLLTQNARRTVSEIAAIARVSRRTAKERIDLMREKGVIKRFTIEVSQQRKLARSGDSAFFLLQLHRPVCRVVYASIKGWPELLNCWSIAGDLDMAVLISATSNSEIERLRGKLIRHPEVKTLRTVTILRDWTDPVDQPDSGGVSKKPARRSTASIN